MIELIWWALGGFVFGFAIVSVINEIRFRRKMARLRALVNRGGA